MMAVTFTLSVVGTPGGSFGTRSTVTTVTDAEGDQIVAWGGYEAARLYGVETPTAEQVTAAVGEMLTGYLKQQGARHAARSA